MIGRGNMNTFLKGSLLLILASFLGECVEFLMNMVLAAELGERGLGLYMSILPTVFLIVLLASFELPISLSKFIAERDFQYHRSMLNYALRMTAVISTVFLLLLALVLPFFPVFDSYHPLFKWLIVVLVPFVSFSSVVRGYFMGKQQMGKIAAANFFRKFVQLGLLVFFFQLFEFDSDTSILIAFFAFVGSEIVITLYLLHMFYVHYQQLKQAPCKRLEGSVLRRSLLSVSIPTTSIRIFDSLTHAVQPFLIKAALVRSGMEASLATEQYGLLAGVAMTIGFFPAFIAHSLLVALIPAVSRLNAEENSEKLRSLLKKVVGFTFLYGLPVSFVFYFYGDVLARLFLDSEAAARFLQILIPYFLLHFFLIPLQAYLIGLGLLKDAFFHNVWGTFVSFGLMYVLGSFPGLRMDGVIIGMNTGAVLISLMHYVTVCKKIGISSLSLRPLANSRHF